MGLTEWDNLMEKKLGLQVITDRILSTRKKAGDLPFPNFIIFLFPIPHYRVFLPSPSRLTLSLIPSFTISHPLIKLHHPWLKKFFLQPLVLRLPGISFSRSKAWLFASVVVSRFYLRPNLSAEDESRRRETTVTAFHLQ